TGSLLAESVYCALHQLSFTHVSPRCQKSEDTTKLPDRHPFVNFWSQRPATICPLTTRKQKP
ncbi:MAG: hypothetical protein ACOVO0_14150, partial [Burkholderiaceae bacterium]